MIKRNKLKLIISSIVILLPMLIGFFGGSILPEELIVHWGIDGNPDGWMSPTVFFILPAVLLAIHWVCMIITAVVDKNAEQNKKIMNMTFWIIPVISLTSSGVIFTTALGYTSNMYAIILLVIGVSFIIIGNYMPKTTRNRTMGIKIKWAMSNDENWNATHRFGGKVMVSAGFLCFLLMPLPSAAFPFVAIPLILLTVLLPIIYSYRFYKKQLTQGKVTREEYERGYEKLVGNKKIALIVTLSITALLVIVLSIIMFTGSIETTLGEDAITVKATYWSDLAVKYEDIDSAEYRAEGVEGRRVSGFGSAKLLLGIFENEEFGTYTRYTYTGDKPCVVLKINERTVVIGAENEQSVRDIYNRISAEIAE